MRPSARPEQLRDQAILGGLALGSALVARALPASAASGGWPLSALPDLCLFHRLTGQPCLTCGLTRSFIAGAHGHWAQALQLHPLGPVFLVMTVLAGAGLLLASAYARTWGLTLSRQARTALGAGVLAALAISWIPRLLGGS